MSAECIVQRLVELLEKIHLLLEPEIPPLVAAHQFVRQAVEADLPAVALLDEIFKRLRNALGVRFNIELVRERWHRSADSVDRRVALAESLVVVVREPVKRLLRLAVHPDIHARKGRRKLAERLDNALVAELVRHQRRQTRLRVLETEAREKPRHLRTLNDYIRHERHRGVFGDDLLAPVLAGILPLGLSRQRHPREKRDRAPYQSLHVSPPFSFGAFTISVDIFKTFLIGFLRQVHLQAI